MQITSGLFDHIVLQRTAKDISDAAVQGTCSGSGDVVATVTRKGKAVRGLAKAKVGTAAKGKFQARIKGMPVGGPYDVELTIGSGAAAKRLTVKDVLVGDVWLLAGQSNMQGVGWVPEGAPVNRLVRAFYMDDRWDVAADPLHNLWDSVDQVHADLCGGERPAPMPKGLGTCPGPSFGQEMLRRSGGVPQGLLACAHGGTSMEQWEPKLKKLGGTSLYGAMVRRIAKNGGQVAGMLWYQGCSEASEERAATYTQAMKKLVAAVRRDTGRPRLPWVVVQIGRAVTIGNPLWWDSIQDQERRLPEVIHGLAVVPVIDLPLDDLIHLSGAAQWRLGKRMAQAMDVLVGGRKAGPPPIAFKSATVVKDKRAGTGNIVVEFENVVGSLRAQGEASGFQASDGENDAVFRIDLDGSKATLKTPMSAQDLASRFLYYGKGCNPFCNITDEADRSLPVLGPIYLNGSPRAMTPYHGNVLVSNLLPSAGKLETLKCPEVSKLELEYRNLGQFCSRRAEFVAAGTKDVLAYYVARFECDEAMRLNVILGYDGPIKAWLDGKQILHDPNGKPPAAEDMKCIPVQAAAGKHEIVVALASNNGKAWGIFLRLERLGVPARVIQHGPGAYRMPKFVM